MEKNGRVGKYVCTATVVLFEYIVTRHLIKGIMYGLEFCKPLLVI